MNISSNTKPELRLDWCSYKAAKYACEHWHYSDRMPLGKLVKIGVWEDSIFIGCILFARGNSPTLGKSYGCCPAETCELVRVALNNHQASVSRILKVALKFLKQKCPSLRLVVSFADPVQKHHGGIYQAGNWIYDGDSKPEYQFFCDGRWKHRREVTSGSFGTTKKIAYKDLPKKLNPGKHRYLYPLTPEMRAKIEPLAKPYPKRASNKGNHPDQGQGGGAVPT